MTMAYKFKDLIVTLVPHGAPESEGSGGGTVGSCTSDCAVEECFDSGELVELSPYSYIDPRYLLELRQLLVYSLAKSGIKTQKPQSVQELEKQMHPRNLKEIEVLETALTTALYQVQQQKNALKNKTH